MLLHESTLRQEPTKKFNLEIGNTIDALKWSDCPTSEEHNWVDSTSVNGLEDIKPYLDAYIKPYDKVRYGCETSDFIYVYMWRYGEAYELGYRHDTDEGWLLE